MYRVLKPQIHTTVHRLLSLSVAIDAERVVRVRGEIMMCSWWVDKCDGVVVMVNSLLRKFFLQFWQFVSSILKLVDERPSIEEIISSSTYQKYADKRPTKEYYSVVRQAIISLEAEWENHKLDDVFNQLFSK